MAETAAALDYPPTPDLAGRMPAAQLGAILAAHERQARARRVRRVATAVAAIATLCLIALAVPPVRAALLQILRLGAVQITLQPTPQANATPTIPVTLTPQSTVTPTITPRPLSSVLDLTGQTTLEHARAELRFPVGLPTYPTDLGPPDAAFIQDLGDQTVMLVWMDRSRPGRVRLALHVLGPQAFVEKVRPRVVATTAVHGRRALWAVGEYLLRSRSGNPELRRLITGNVLIWTDGDITYRLETDLAMPEAVRIAESVR
jgi:hypothetical protein